jgi:hypothetical protein
LLNKSLFFVLIVYKKVLESFFEYIRLKGHDEGIMKIAILSRNPNFYSTKRLKKSAEDLGHVVDVIDTFTVIWI